MKKVTTSIYVFTICVLMLAASCTKEKINFEPKFEKANQFEQTTQNNSRDTPYLPTSSNKLDTPYVFVPNTTNKNEADTPYVKH